MSSVLASNQPPNSVPLDAYGEEIDIIDIQQQGLNESLKDIMKANLSTFNGNTARFPTLLLWNETGLKIFEEITFLDDYYLTNAEIEVLNRHSFEIAENIPSGSLIVELGSGSLRKVRILLQTLDSMGRSVDYYALDVSRSELRRTLAMIPPGTFKNVRCHGLLGTYDDARSWLKHSKIQRPRFILSLGSSIGNFTKPEAASFIAGFVDIPDDALSANNQSTIILGLDASKSHDKVYRAYNDGYGINKRFILNGLAHANSLFKRPVFELENWEVVGHWDTDAGRHCQYLVPLKDVVLDDVCLRAGNPILIVFSQKYDREERAQLWKSANVIENRQWRTRDKSYGIHLLSRNGTERASRT